MKNIIALVLMVLSINLLASNDMINQINLKSDKTNSSEKLLSPDTVCFTILIDYNNAGEQTGYTVQTWNTIGDLNCEESFALLMLIWIELNS